MARHETTFCYSAEDLTKRLDMPKDTVIIEMYTSIVNANPRRFCFKISVDTKELKKYMEQKSKKGD